MTSASVRRYVRALAVVLCTTWLSGCELSALGQQPPTQIYVLSTLEDQGTVAPANSGGPGRDVTIGVSTVGFPPYLERKEIVTRATDSQLVVHRFDKWGSAPDEDFARAMAANLRVLVPTRAALIPPFRPESPLDYEVRFTVDRFERLADGTVVLEARWVVWQQPEGRPLLTRTAQTRVANAGEAIPQVVAAMSQALAQLSEQVATDLRTLPRRQGQF